MAELSAACLGNRAGLDFARIEPRRLPGRMAASVAEQVVFVNEEREGLFGPQVSKLSSGCSGDG